MRKRVDENLKAVIQVVRQLEAQGTLEPGKRQVLERSIRELSHATKIGDRKALTAAVDKIARCFVRELES